jgi:membrane-bound lytic murein transglycosylase F
MRVARGSMITFSSFPHILLAAGCVLILLVSATGCERTSRGGDLDKIRERGTLIVLTRNAPTMYFEGRDGLAGMEYEMAAAFAEHLGVKPEFKIKETIGETLEALAEGKGDLAAAGLTPTPARLQTFLAGPTYQMVEQQVVCRRGGPRVNGIEGLGDVKLMVPAESSYVERLEQLREYDPELTWEVSDEDDTEQLLERVWEETLDCTVADSNIVAINRRYYPELVVAFNLTDPEPLAWLLPPKAKALKKAVDDWFKEYKDNGNVERLIDKYYGFIKLFDYVDTRAFSRRIDELLPRYRPLFRKAGREFDLSWSLLAAQSYQESHWRPRAKSPTGVKGIMMLTLPTARAMGVTNRLNPEESIRGGAKYLTRLRDRLPDEIEEPDRTWLALAAYNVGLGHLLDARRLAKRLGKEPDSWSGLSESLPLLAQRKHYRTLEHGYARGRESVRYVNRIRNYRDILERTLRSAEATP